MKVFWNQRNNTDKIVRENKSMFEQDQFKEISVGENSDIYARDFYHIFKSNTKDSHRTTTL